MSERKPKRRKPTEIELVPDAWPRFEQFVRDIAKAGPQHKAASKKPAKTRKKKAEHI
jgi:hypothetical protein